MGAREQAFDRRKNSVHAIQHAAYSRDYIDGKRELLLEWIPLLLKYYNVLFFV